MKKDRGDKREKKRVNGERLRRENCYRDWQHRERTRHRERERERGMN